jgi:hypothetical protein
VLRDLLTAALAIAAVSNAARLNSSQQPPSNATAANATPANVSSTGGLDPAAVTFTTDFGLVLHAVKPGSVADYENAIVALQEAMATSPDEDVRKMAAGWRVFKATELDAKANPLYVHWLQPAMPGVDYRPSLWLDKLLEGAPPELLAKYRDAFAVAPSKLALTEFATMSVAPIPKPTNATPTNATPTNGTPPRPPGFR